MTELIIELLTVALLLVMMYLQIKNFLKYKKMNGANKVRILVMLSTTCSMTQAVIFAFSACNGYFFDGAVLLFSMIYLINPE